MLQFSPGLELCERFFQDAVQPILRRHVPDVPYSAARLDTGSEVLGFDTPRSTDHDWGLRLTLFLEEENLAGYGDPISAVLGVELPHEFSGVPTHYETPERDGGHPRLTAERPIQHRIDVTTPERFFRDYLGLDSRRPPDLEDWLAMPTQKLATVASGRIFHDGLGRLCAIQRDLAWYPHDIWLYLMASQWRKIDQEEPFVLRCSDVGDELGSQLVASRQVVEAMRLAFLMERRYAPYMKWFGSAFSRLACGPTLGALLQDVLSANDGRLRERAMSRAYSLIGEMHNALAVTTALEIIVSRFHSRPYLVPHSSRFVDALTVAIESADLRARLSHQPVGGVGQCVDSTDVLCDPQWCRGVVQAIYGRETSES